MSLDIVSVGPLYLGPDMNKIRLLTTDAARKLAFPPKSFIPSKTKLTTIETKRIMSVLDEAIRKVELVTLLSDVIANKEALEKMLGEDIMRAVREHEDLCKTLQDHISELSDQEKQVQQLEDMEDERGLRDLQFLMQEEKYSLPPLMRQIKDATKNILRLLLSNPQATRFLEMQKLSRSTQAQSFINSLVELRGFLFEKLLTSPMEVREKTQYIQSISRQNKRNQETIATLEHELAKSLKNRDAEVEKENFVIQELKNHLHQVLKFSENSLLRTKQEAEKQQKADFRASQARMAKIQQEILKLRTRYHNLVTENREQEQALRKKKYKVETEIENWIQKYDAEMSEKQTEFEDLEVIHKEEKAQLEELRKKHDVLVEEFSQIRSEREVDSKKRMEAEEQLLRMVRAATLIQAMWKGYLVRSMLRTKRKKWGKGKGKAKGKEGKGKEGKGKEGKGKGKEKAKGKK